MRFSVVLGVFLDLIKCDVQASILEDKIMLNVSCKDKIHCPLRLVYFEQNPHCRGHLGLVLTLLTCNAAMVTQSMKER